MLISIHVLAHFLMTSTLGFIVSVRIATNLYKNYNKTQQKQKYVLILRITQHTHVQGNDMQNIVLFGKKSFDFLMLNNLQAYALRKKRILKYILKTTILATYNKPELHSRLVRRTYKYSKA